MSKLKAWIYAFRLRTLPLSLSSIITGSGIAFAQDRAHFNWLTFTLCVLTTLFLQILSNLANDYGDSEKGTDNEYRIGPVRAVQSGMLSFKEMKTGIVVTALLCLASGSWLVREATKDLDISKSIFFFLLGLTAIAAAIKYTVGKNAYGYMGLGDVFVLFFFGFVGVAGSYYLLSHKVDMQVLLPALSIGLFAAGVLNVNNMRDYDSDIKSGKLTLAGKLGIPAAKTYHSTLIIIGFMASIVYVYLNLISSIQFLFIITLLLFKKHINAVQDVEELKDFDPQLKQLAISTFIFSVLFVAGLVIGTEV